jgi:hypothetical protein
VDRAELAAPADGRPQGQRDALLLVREVPVLGGLVDEAVHRERDEVGEHDLEDGAQPGCGATERGAGERELGDRRVEDAVGAVALREAGRRLEDAAGVRHVLAEEHHVLVAPELLVERLPDAALEVDPCHRS